MATKQRDSKREVFWRDASRCQAASELSVRACYRRRRLSEPSFHASRRTLREHDAPHAAKPTAFVPVVQV